MTTTTAGLVVPYIVRVERGTLNRGIYDIAVLFNPNSTTPWTALTPAAAMERQGRLHLRQPRPASRGCSSALKQNWAMTRPCRAASWLRTTASPTRSTTRTAS